LIFRKIGRCRKLLRQKHVRVSSGKRGRNVRPPHHLNGHNNGGRANKKKRSRTKGAKSSGEIAQTLDGGPDVNR